MSKIRNTGFSSLYLAYQSNADTTLGQFWRCSITIHPLSMSCVDLLAVIKTTHTQFETRWAYCGRLRYDACLIFCQCCRLWAIISRPIYSTAVHKK